jgi:hypothetical protein
LIAFRGLADPLNACLSVLRDFSGALEIAASILRFLISISSFCICSPVIRKLFGFFAQKPAPVGNCRPDKKPPRASKRGVRLRTLRFQVPPGVNRLFFSAFLQ